MAWTLTGNIRGPAAVIPDANPRGHLGRQERTTSTSSVTAEAVVNTTNVTFTVVSGRLYKVSFAATCLSTVAADTVLVRIRAKAGTTTPSTADTQLLIHRTAIPVANFGFGMSTFCFMSTAGVYTGAATAGSWTVAVSIERGSGTGSVSLVGATTQPIVTAVEDVGLA